jgi:hypothetical protein
MGNLLFAVGLVVPVALFWWLRARGRPNAWLAAALAIAAGWAINLAWAFAVRGTPAGDPAQLGGDPVAIASLFGWFCPSALVGLTALVRRFVVRAAPPA